MTTEKEIKDLEDILGEAIVPTYEAEAEDYDGEEQNPNDNLTDDFFDAQQEGSDSAMAWIPEEVDVEGVGADDMIDGKDYIPRLSAPSSTDKNWIKTTYGGYNYCIHIANGSCLPNCVGYAWGRWREILGAYHKLSRGNAENWYPNTGDGYERGQTPRLGAVICWRKGKIYNGNDGAGHVAIVEKVYSDGTIVTSNSAWGGTRFYLKTIKPPYSIGSAYTFQGFIYNPKIRNSSGGDQPTETEFFIGDEVIINGPLYRSSSAASASGSVSNKTTKITRKVLGAAHPYNTTGDLGWMDAKNIKKVKEEPKPEPQPEPTPQPEPEKPREFKFNIGDKVIINGNLYRSAAATTPAGSVRNRTTYITRRVDGLHPYNTTGDLGWMNEEDIMLTSSSANTTELKVGDKVKVLKAVTYTGKTFNTWYSKYDVIQVSGDRIVIGIGSVVTAAVHRRNLQKV